MASGLLIVLTTFGVLLMHSLIPTTSTPAAMSGAHDSMASATAFEASVPVAFGEHDCPSAHQLMHPCLGATASWPALTAPTMSAEFDLSPTSTEGPGKRVDRTQERAPPWTLWELDKSVTLRV